MTFCQTQDIAPTSIDLVGIHAPDLQPLQLQQTDNASTVPRDWNALITAKTGISAVFNFSIIESAVTRPLIPPVAFVDNLFLRHPTKFRVCLNIEELANISFIPALIENDFHSTISYNCGPGSLLINYAMRYCTANDHAEDYNGKFGSEGHVNQEVADRFLSTRDYLQTPPTLSMAREMFGDHDAQQLIDECMYLNMSYADIIATTTRITAQNILRQYLRLLEHFFGPDKKVDELFICGPSARNSNIIDYLEAELPESVITKPLDDIGIPGEANDAVCCAHLALEAVLGQATQPRSRPASPTSAHSNGAIVKGKIVRGTQWEGLLVQIHQFSEGKSLQVTKDVRVAGNLETAIKTLGLR